MQWLTAILAFATTMLIFAIVVSALVEILHRVLGSRTFGLITMLEHYYDDVLVKYFDGATNKIERDDFVKNMVRVRAPGIADKTITNQGFLAKVSHVIGILPRLLKRMYSKLAGTSKFAAKLGYSNWSLMDSLPVETFMERLGTLGFDDALNGDDNGAGKGGDDKADAPTKDAKDRILKDIAQKFELYGSDSALYFERKANTFSVVIAFFVAWTFYVHPYDLVHTYLRNPEAAAKVAELSDSTLEQFEEQKKTLESAKAAAAADNFQGKRLDELLDAVDKELANGQHKAKLLEDAGAPIGWPADPDRTAIWQAWCNSANDCKVTLNYPRASKDIFWLLMGGILIGLGAPFWVKAITRVGEARRVTRSLTGILKPQTQASDARTMAPLAVATDDMTPLTTLAFKAAAAAAKASGSKKQN